MNIKLSFRDMSFYCGIPYDFYNRDPEKWNKLIKILILLPEQDADLRWNVMSLLGDKIQEYLGLPFSTEDGFVSWDPNDYESNRSYTDKLLDINEKEVSDMSNDSPRNKNVIISFEGGSGANFLRNCLHFSDSVPCISSPFDITSSHTNLLVSTLDNIEEKLNYIISETKDQSVWTDPKLYLNCKSQDNKILITLLHQDIEKTLSYTSEVVPNCKTIIFYKNTTLFKYLREYTGAYVWDVDKSTVGAKQTILQFTKKSQETKKRTIDLCNDKTQVYSHCYIDSKITFYVWDTNWYFSEKDTINHIEELYELLSLSGFNENAISKYYNMWIKTLDDLKTKTLNETT